MARGSESTGTDCRRAGRRPMFSFLGRMRVSSVLAPAYIYTPNDAQRCRHAPLEAASRYERRISGRLPVAIAIESPVTLRPWGEPAARAAARPVPPCALVAASR